MRFALAVDEFVRKAKLAPDVVVRRAALGLHRDIVMATPVGNPKLWKSKPPAGYVGGRARASWGIGLNRYGDMQVTAVDRDGNTTIHRAAAQLATYQPGDSIWIGSALPYIGRLEYGYSNQAPHGMVRVAIANWNNHLTAAIRSLPT